jgi:hypothetical protein
MNIGEVPLDLCQIDLRLGDDSCQIPLVARLVAVEIHEHEVLERCNGHAHAEEIRGCRFGYHRALWLTRRHEKIDLPRAMRQNVHRLRVARAIDRRRAAKANVLERVERLPRVVVRHDEIEVLGETWQASCTESGCLIHCYGQVCFFLGG